VVSILSVPPVCNWVVALRIVPVKLLLVVMAPNPVVIDPALSTPTPVILVKVPLARSAFTMAEEESTPAAEIWAIPSCSRAVVPRTTFPVVPAPNVKGWLAVVPRIPVAVR
jgi:hypothetical protein